MLRKKKKAPVEIQDPVLSDRLSFLDVIVETCKHSGRHTLIADTGDATYTVMIDSGGPFNADGGGLSGREVLVKAASLRHGTYTKLQGWPVDQPTYQLGLAQALQGLVMGTKPEEAPLPPARGVNAMRNATFETVGKPAGNGEAPDPFALTPTNGGRLPDPFAPSRTAAYSPAATDPFTPSATNDGGLHKSAPQAGPWTMAETPKPIPKPVPSTSSFETAPSDHPFMAAFAPVVDAPTQPAPPAEPAPRADTAVAVAEAAPAVRGEPPIAASTVAEPIATVAEPAVVEPPRAQPPITAAVVAEPIPTVAEPVATTQRVEPLDTVSYLRQAARASDSVDPTAAPPAARKPPGLVKRRVLQFVLWTVEVEGDPAQYTLGQALGLLAHSLGAGLTLILSPVTRPFTTRWHQARDDWRRSGEVAARQKSQRAKSSSKPDDRSKR